jgi:chromatin remodeling complex protein RSC6
MTKTEKTTGRMPNAALMKPVQPDDALAVIVGSTPLPRGELTKKLWDYIKKNKLQDEKKRALINADDALKVVFGGKKQVSMFEMTKLVSGHVKWGHLTRGEIKYDKRDPDITEGKSDPVRFDYSAFHE